MEDLFIEKPLDKAIPYDGLNVDYILFSNEKVMEAEKYAEDNNLVIILPYRSVTDNAITLQDLEKQWTEFNSVHLQLRRMADWKTLELFSMTNKEIYEYLKSRELGRDIENDRINDDNTLVIPEKIEIKEGYFDDDMERSYMDDGVEGILPYGQKEIEEAIDWSNSTGYPIIVPAKNLDQLEVMWDNFNSVPYKYRKFSDMKSVDLFGITNQDHYIYLKRVFLNDDIPNYRIDDDYEDDEYVYITPFDHHTFIESFVKDNMIGKENISTIIDTLIEASTYDNSNYYQANIKRTIKRVLDEDEVFNTVDVDFLPSSELPFYSPDEMIDMGVFSTPVDNYYGIEADNVELADDISTKTWFEEYKYHFNGIDTPNRKDLYIARLKKLTDLCTQLEIMKKYETDSKKINARKQSILELGWNPELPFTPENRAKAAKMYKENNNAHVSSKFIDLRNLPLVEQEFVVDTKLLGPLRPVYIVLSEGGALFSKVIKGFTRSIYSHASLSFDSELKDLYSFNSVDDKGNFGKGRFEIEHFNTRFVKDNHLAVFAVFLKEKDYNTMKKNVDWLLKHIDETKYSFINLLAIAFKITPIEGDTREFCSQFVDRMFKLIGVDITGMKSQCVVPGEIFKQSKKNNKIYTVFEDLAKNFKGDKIERTIKQLNKRNLIFPAKEGALYSDLYNSFLESYYTIEEIEYEHHIVNNKMTFTKIDSLIESFKI